jgi:uncharacterized membrane protein
LVIGLGSLLKYAWDENWVSVPMRIGAGLLAGIALLAGGHISHARAKTKWFEQGLLGGGLGTLYVTGYSAFAGYHLVPFAVAYSFMSVITLAAFLLSVKYESLPMALIGWAGGFMTPFAISDGGENAIGLASYIVLLDIGLLAVSLARRGWFALQPLALLASYVAACSWYLQHRGDIPAIVSTVSLLSMWSVFFLAGISETLRADGRSAFATLLRRCSAFSNGVVFWSFARQVLAGDSDAFAWLALGVSVAYSAAYVLFVRRIPNAGFERLQYALGAAAMVMIATASRCAHFEFVTMMAAEAALVAAAVFAARRLRADGATLREGTIVSLGRFATGTLGAMSMPDALAFGGHAFELAFGSRDAMLATVFVCAALVDRLTRGALRSTVPGIVLRLIAVAAPATFESVHLAGDELSIAYALDALAVIVSARLLGAVGRSYGEPVEPGIVSLVLMISSALCFSFAPDAFAASANAWSGVFGIHDVALLAFASIAFALDRLGRSDRRLHPMGLVFRQLGMVGVVALDLAHARGLGLAAVFALEAIALVAADRALRRLGTAYAPSREPAIAAALLGASGWLAFSAAQAPLDFLGRHAAFGIGGVDLALAALAGAALAIERAYRRELHPIVRIGLRQSIVAGIVLASLVHARGLDLGESLALEALAFALVGTRTMVRDIEIAGLAFVAGAIGAVITAPDTWHTPDIFRFELFRDARFFAIMVCSIATAATGEIYRRRSTLPPWTGRSARIAGIALAALGATVEVRDAFERAIAAARLETPVDIDLVARLTNSEGLGISAVWLLTSLLLVGIGIRFRVREWRIAAIALFDMTILKAFFIDLNSLATPYRIVSFIALGLTLLGVSYVYQRLERGYFERPSDPTNLIGAEAA